MPAYQWTCLACGHSNEPGGHACVDCACAAEASRNEITRHRDGYQARGGRILPGAAKLPEPDDNEILKVFASLGLRFLSIVG